MCDPTGISYVAIAAAVMSTAVSVYGQVQQGQAATKQANYQKQVAENNAILANRAAQDALDRGEVAARNQRIKTEALKGRQRAVLAGNGVVVDEGSALDITDETAAFGKLDELTIKSNSEREAAGFRAQGMNFQSEANLASMSATNAKNSMYLGVAGSTLSGVGSVAGKWYGFSRAGVGTPGGSTYWGDGQLPGNAF